MGRLSKTLLLAFAAVTLLLTSCKKESYDIIGEDRFFKDLEAGNGVWRETQIVDATIYPDGTVEDSVTIPENTLLVFYTRSVVILGAIIPTPWCSFVIQEGGTYQQFEYEVEADYTRVLFMDNSTGNVITYYTIEEHSNKKQVWSRYTVDNSTGIVYKRTLYLEKCGSCDVPFNPNLVESGG